MTSKKRFLLSVASFFILVAIFGIASGQSGKEAEGRAAEQAGRLRDALTHYVAALQSTSEGSNEDQRLRETIIKLVQKLSPPPAVPEEAERRLARGRASVKAATDEQGFLRAASEFQQAVKAAPWLADGYFNLGIVLAKAGRHADAIRSLKLYLLAAPNATDAKQVREQIYEIEYRQEEAQRAKAKEAAEQVAKAEAARNDQILAARMVGVWSPPTHEVTNLRGQKIIAVRGIRIRIQAEGTRITATCIGVPTTNADFTESWWGTPAGLPLPFIEGRIEGGRLVGTENEIWYRHDGAGIRRSKPINTKIEFNADGTWFKLGDIDWNAWKGKDGHLFYGKDKQ